MQNKDCNDLHFRTEEQKEAALADTFTSSVLEKGVYV